MTQIQELYQTLHQRKRPEDVAQLILEILEKDLTREQMSKLDKAAAGSLKRINTQYTSMLQVFAPVVGAGKQVRKAIELFNLQELPGQPQFDDPTLVSAFVSSTSVIIKKNPGWNNFTKDRLNKSERRGQGLDISKRNYNKKWRLLKRLESKVETLLLEHKKLEFQLISKHGISHHLSFDTFSADTDAACFIAYITARGNLRSEFTVKGQQRAFDEICDMLLKRCESKQESGIATNWNAITYAYTSSRTLKYLTDEQKGILLGKWTLILEDIAGLLSKLWEENSFEKQTMVVKRGDDSSTWNNTAGAWNKARDSWINLVYSLGLDYLLDDICFGKVMRLMAADVVQWHASTGGKLDPNTEVWNLLPLPWEVFAQTATCTRTTVTACCNTAGIDPEKSGWMAPRETGIATFRPTPELVHGVTVSCPFLALVLKKNNYFSGKDATPFFPENN